jgi:hypothetical protein
MLDDRIREQITERLIANRSPFVKAEASDPNPDCYVSTASTNINYDELEGLQVGDLKLISSRLEQELHERNLIRFPKVYEPAVLTVDGKNELPPNWGYSRLLGRFTARIFVRPEHVPSEDPFQAAQQRVDARLAARYQQDRQQALDSLDSH